MGDLGGIDQTILQNRASRIGDRDVLDLIFYTGSKKNQIRNRSTSPRRRAAWKRNSVAREHLANAMKGVSQLRLSLLPISPDIVLLVTCDLKATARSSYIGFVRQVSEMASPRNRPPLNHFVLNAAPLPSNSDGTYKKRLQAHGHSQNSSFSRKFRSLPCCICRPHSFCQAIYNKVLNLAENTLKGERPAMDRRGGPLDL